jgi:hypothetical protein
MPRGVPYSAAQRDTVLRARDRRATVAECGRLAGLSEETARKIIKLAWSHGDRRARPLADLEYGALIAAGIRRGTTFAERSARMRQVRAARGAGKHHAPSAPPSPLAAGPLHREQHGDVSQ